MDAAELQGEGRTLRREIKEAVSSANTHMLEVVELAVMRRARLVVASSRVRVVGCWERILDQGWTRGKEIIKGESLRGWMGRD